ncbi:MAG: TolC family protein, partial [Bradymonadaceae bacterium]
PACAGKTYTDRRDDVVDPPRSYTAEGIDGLETDRWCSDFGQKGLERAVRRAWEENLELKAAWARIERARAEAAEVRSNLWPTLSTTAGATV